MHATISFFEHEEFSFGNSVEKFMPKKNEQYSLNARRLKKNIKFMKNIVYYKRGLWIRRLRFSNSAQKRLPKQQNFLPEHQKVLIQCPNLIKIYNFLKKNKFFSKCSSGHVEGSFENSAVIILPEG